MKNWLDLATRAARQAGEFLRGYDRQAIVVLSEEGKDIKIGPDKESERLLIDRLTAESPFSILSEEEGSIERDDACLWVIDPLDGSLNFLRGMPSCCVSIALCRGSTPLLGVIYDFNRDELFSGIVGEGAWLNDRPMHVSAVPERARAVLCTGFPSQSSFSTGALATFLERVQAFKKVRLLGSAALSLAYVACGRVDAYTERGIKWWDVAAGVALVQAAGGEAQLLEFQEGNAVDILMTNARLEPTVGTR